MVKDGYDAATAYDFSIPSKDVLRTLVKKANMTIAIGDYTTYMFHQFFNRFPDVYVFDGRCADKEIQQEMDQLIVEGGSVHNGLCEVSSQLNERMYNAILVKRSGAIKVIGEEDNAVFLAKLYAPNDALIIWGDYNSKCTKGIFGGETARMEGLYGLPRTK